MSDRIEKTQHERLPSLYGSEIAGKPFRILGSSWERYKSSYNFREDKVFAMRSDLSLPASAPGNFLKWDDDTKDYVEANYSDFDSYTVKRADGTEFRGRIVNSDHAPWEDDGTGKPNFELETSEGWKAVDYNALTDGGAKVEHVARIKRVEYLPVSLLTPAKAGDKTVQRVKLELTKTASDALAKITGALAKADADPKNYIYAFTYVEADKQYVIREEDYRKMLDDEKSAAAEEDANAATSSIDALTPPGAKREGGDPSWMDNTDAKIDEIGF